MGGFDPIYDCDDTEGLSEKEKEQLRNAVLRALNSDQQVRELLKKKTESVYNSIKSKKKPKKKP